MSAEEDIQRLVSCQLSGNFARLRMQGIPVAPDDVETARLALLKSLDILDSKESESFDRITSLVRTVIGTPIALVSLVDVDRQWFLSNVTLYSPEGTERVKETPREQAFCNYAIDPELQSDIFLVADAEADPRFCNNPLVKGYPHIRFYAGAPLKFVTNDGELFRLGSLCAIDTVARPAFSLREKQALLDLAALVVDEIKLRARLTNDVIQAQARYIASTAHNLRTPLMVFQLSLALLQQSKPTAEQSEPIHYAQMSVEMMRMTVENSISIAQSVLPNNNTLTEISPTIQPVNVHELQRRTANLAQKLFPFQVPVHWVVSDDVKKALIHTDESVLTMCLLNLLSNACKYTEEGSVEVKLRLVLGRTNGSRMLRLEVKDTGPGIVKREAVFEPFVGLNSNNATEKEGTGLGLYSIKFQIKRLGGNIGYHDNKVDGRGSVFWVELPDVGGCAENDARGVQEEYEVVLSPGQPAFKRQHSPEDPAQEAQEGSPSAKLRLEHIDGELTALIVDDSELIRKLLGKVLSKLGFSRVEHAHNGSHGLEMLVRSPPYSVIFMDMLMPVMNGVECVDKFREWEATQTGRPHQFIVGISANASAADVEKAMSRGMDHFVNKPLTLKVVSEIINLIPKPPEFENLK